MRPKKNKVCSDPCKPNSFDLYLPTLEGDEDCYSDLIIHLFTELTRVSTSDEKASVIEKVINTFCHDSEDDVGPVTQLLFTTLLQLSAKNMLRRKLIRSLALISEKFPNSYYNSVEETVRLNLTYDSNFDILLNTMAIIIERKDVILPNLDENSLANEGDFAFQQDLFFLIYESSASQIKLLWSKAINSQTSSAETNSLFQVVHQIVRNLTILLQDKIIHFKGDPPIAASSTLLSELLQIVTSVITPLDLRNSCGLLAIQLQIAKERDLFGTFEEVLYRKGLFESIEDMGQMALFHGLLCHVEGRQLFTPIPIKNQSIDTDLATQMLETLFRMINTAQIGSVTVLGCRILNHLMIRLLECVGNMHDIDKVVKKNLCQKYSVHSNNAKTVIDMIWLLWDHFLDSVKHIAREVFIVFIKIQDHVNRDDALSYFTKLGNSLAQSLSRKQSFSALTCLVPFIGADFLLASNPDMVNTLLRMLSDSAYATHSSNLLEALFTKHHSEIDYEEWHHFWFSVFFKNFSKEMLVYGYENLLEKLILASKDTMKPIVALSSSAKLSDVKLCLLIMCTKISLKTPKKTKDKTVEISSSFSDPTCTLWKGILPFQFLVTSLKSGDEALGILAFSLLCESSKSTELYDERELQIVMAFIERNIANQDASFRQKLVSNVKKVLSRINKGIACKVKSCFSVTNKSKLQELMKIHQDFVRGLFEFLLSNLCSVPSFPRRVSSLQILELLFDVLHDGASFTHLKSELFSSSVQDSLMVCLGDSYENNKQIAMKLLQCMSRHCFSHNRQTNSALVENVWALASSPKPPDSLTASYILNVIVNDPLSAPISGDDLPVPITENRRLVACWTVLTKLQRETRIAQVSLFKAAASGPMYGLLLCLRSLFANLQEEDIVNMEHLWSDIIEKTVSICLLIANIVADVVKNSSPEGHLPMDLNVDSKILKEAVNSSIAAQENGFKESQNEFSVEELVKAQAVSAQMLLLCGWRSIKEVSLLFGLLIQGPNSATKILSLLSLKDVRSIGTFFLNQLTETKHRGAFEQAYSGFGMICDKLFRCTSSEMNKLPEIWLNDTLRAIQDENATHLCATRRSAGVPFIIQAIISAEPSIKGGSCLRSTMETLLKIASFEAELEAKIHALNILRALFRDARIGEAVIPYVSEGVKVAVGGYKNNSWSVRNSSTLMFAALVNRMLGVKKIQEDLHSKNAVSALVFFRRYPDLYDFFLENMRASVGDMKKGDLSPSTFPYLVLLARLAPASSDGYSTSIPLTPFIPFILEFSSSPMYQLRSLASRALIPLITPLTLVGVVEQLCSALSLENQNHLHGTLLCLTQIIKSFSEIISASDEIRNKVNVSLSSVMWVAREVNPCLFTRACGIELFTFMVIENLLSSPLALKSLTASCFSLQLTLHQKCSHIPGGVLAIKASTTLFLTVHNRHKKENIEPLLNLLEFPSPEVRCSVLQHFLTLKEFGQLLNQRVIAAVKTKEELECSNLLYNLLTKIILSFKEEEFTHYRNDLDDIFILILVKFNFQVREELLATMIETSGIIIQYKLKFGDELKEKIIVKWIESMDKFSATDFSPEVRLAVAKNISETLSSLHLNSGLGDKIELLLVKIVLELLSDDDQFIQAVVSKHTSNFLKRNRLKYGDFQGDFEDEISYPPPVILESLLFYLASKGLDGHFTLLLCYALKEDLPEEFGLSQEEDRAFEKGETKIYREEIHLTKLVSKAIKETVNEKGLSSLSRLQVDVGMLHDHLLLPIPNSISLQFDTTTFNVSKSTNQSTNRFCSLPNFIKILKREIEFVLDHFEQLKETSPFGIRHFDLWLERLARRALVWTSLKKIAIQDSIHFEGIILVNLESSLLKPIILNHILEWLQ